MKFIKAFKQALNMVIHSKLRSWLTILGIVIGVAAVISIVSMGQALSADLGSQLGDLGGDLLTLNAGAAKAMTFSGRMKDTTATATSSDEEIVLDKTDVQALKGVSDIKTINMQISGKTDVYFVAESGSTTIQGVDQATWSQVATSTIAQGRMLGPADSNVIVVGGRIADGFFDKKIGINQMVTIEEKLFRIVGILDDTSSTIYMPLQTAYEVLDDKEKDVYDTIIIQVKDEEQLDTAMAAIEKKLMLARHVTESNKDFTLTSNQAATDARADMMASLTMFLTAIAAVALLVGAVGVANTMFTSVLEKTKEIGIMKAIGARNEDILKIFLMNSAIIGFIGGVLGLLLGIVLSGFLPALLGDSGGIMSRLASGGSMVSWQSVFLAIGMAVAIGMISGAIPAYKASRLKPVDALRYE